MTNKPVSNETLLQQLRWRYATKRFDPARKIADADWQTLEQALVLTPSSFGLQPWRFFVITDPEIRRKLQPVSWNQTQVVDCSHLVVFAIKKHLGEKEIDQHLHRVAKVRGITPVSLAAYRSLMMGHLVEGPNSLHINVWASRQIYIALGNFMTCAAMLGIDTCPLEGIEPEKYDQILGLAKRGYAVSVACAAGYRSADDKYAAMPKVRFEVNELIEHI